MGEGRGRGGEEGTGRKMGSSMHGGDGAGWGGGGGRRWKWVGSGCERGMDGTKMKLKY